MWRTPGFGQAGVAVSVGGELFPRYAADGIIVATPTGSTADTLSVGGPIVSPVVDAILVTPLAPHGLFNRTLAIAATELLEIDVLGESAPVVVERDGARARAHAGCDDRGAPERHTRAARQARLDEFLRPRPTKAAVGRSHRVGSRWGCEGRSAPA